MATTALGEVRIKRLLVSHLRSTGEAAGARVLTELNVAGFSRRADVVLVNGRLSAFEIKGERDNLDRLAGQVDTYLRYFEQVTVVCAPRHTTGVLAEAPAEVGVWEARPDGLSVVRPAAAPVQQGRPIWLSFLPVRRLSGLLREHGIKPAGRDREQLLAAAEALPTEVVRAAALGYLKSPERAAKVKASRVARREASDPVQDRLMRLREFLDMAGATAGAVKAIPRRVAPSNETEL